MNQLKFSLADLLTVLGTLVYGFICYLSINFLTLGDTSASIVWASVIALALGGLAFGVKLLKITSRNFKIFIIGEWVLLFLFTVTAFIAVFPFSHYFSVYAIKSDIQKIVSSNITQAENMFPEYEKYANLRLDIYKSKLKSIVNNKEFDPNEYKSFGFIQGTDDNTQINNKEFTLKVKLYPSNFKDIKKADSTWLANAKTKISNWSPFGIVNIIKTVNPEISSWKDELKKYSSFRAPGEDVDDFDYKLIFNDVNKKITQISRPTILSVFIAIGLYLLMLLSYFITKRHVKNHYNLFYFFKRGENKEYNEIDIEI
jgi:hypothetical protein